MRASLIIGVIFGALLVAIGAVAWLYRQHARESPPKPPRAIPVAVAAAALADVPIILRGLGTVTAYNTVNIQSRVVGNIEKINFQEGQKVRKGDVLVEIDSRPYQAVYDQARATLARDEANLASARKDLERYAKLQSKNFVPQMQYTDQLAVVAADEATIKIDHASVEAAKLNLDYCSIASPINGVTGIRQVDLGNLVQANSQTLVVVTQIEPIYVIFPLPETETLRVRQAMQNARLTVLAYDASDTKEIARGVLNLVDNEINQTTGTVKLKAQFANTDALLWPGQFVNAHLIVETVENGVVAPSVSVQTGPNGRYVFVVGDKDVVEMRPVTVLQTEHEVSLIGSGLREGERVVTSGYSQLTPGARVIVKDGIARNESG